MQLNYFLMKINCYIINIIVISETGVLRLPCETTLRDYTNVISPSQGFQSEVISELQSLTQNLPESHCWVALLHDEMSIKSNLVYMLKYK